MASVAAAARTGSWNAPYLVRPTPDLDSVLAEGVAPALTEMMREVVQDELGTAPAADVDGHDVGGKTGTAEFGVEEPPETHAWFVGFVDDLSFAVVVEGGGVGGTVAAPIARTFIESLPQAPAAAPSGAAAGAAAGEG
jgi:cell division protein FtsI/penicillin-binding protein 2